MIHLLTFSAVVLLPLLFAVLLDSFRRRNNDLRSSPRAIFEDPNSLNQVPCPNIYDPAEKYMSLIFPAYNEEHRLPAALDEAMEYLKERASRDESFTYEVVVVDDGSSDGTRKVSFDFVRKHGVDCVRVLSLGSNYGKGEAIRKGMLHSRGQLLLMVDADGATRVRDLEKLERQIVGCGGMGLGSGSKPRALDVEVAALGSRAHLEKKALATRKWHRNLLMKGFHIIVLLVAGPGVLDTQCGFKMFTRAAARKLFKNVRLKRWCFDVELVYLCKRLGVMMVEISVNWMEIPGSKVTPLSIINMVWELMVMFVGYNTGMWDVSSI